MKRILLSLLLALIVVVSSNAKQIEKEVAIKKAIEFFSPLIQDKKPDSYSFETIVADGIPVYHIVRFSPEGWVLVSANDETKPIIAYSTTGKFESDNKLESMKNWFDIYNQEIVDAVKNRGEKDARWDLNVANLASSKRVKYVAASYERIEPLIKVNWNQNKPYNNLCPSNTSGTALVGCVAVAMGQAMTVSKYPQKPNGSYSYFHNTYGTLFIDYDQEAPYNWDAIMTGTNNKNEVARLLYHCGVSVKMDYGVSGSGTQSSYIVGALKNHFSYAPSVKSYTRNSYKEDWEELLLNELHAGRAVVYSGNNGGVGHAFNIDGFDGNNMYHVNWGWGGMNNGYYTIDGMKDGDQIYTFNQQMIVGIRPPSRAPQNITLSNMSIQEGLNPGTIVADVIIESEAINPIYTFELKGNYNILIHDYMPAKFYVDEKNQLRTNEMLNFADGDETVIIKVTNKENRLYYEREFIIKVTEKGTGLNNQEIEGLNISKSDNNTILINSSANYKYTIHSVSGQKIDVGDIREGNNFIILNKGISIVTVFDSKQKYSQKVIL